MPSLNLVSSFYLRSCHLLLFFFFVGLELNSIHKSGNQLSTIKEAQGFFVGGGNTFLLLKTLYDLNLLEAIRDRVVQVQYKFSFISCLRFKFKNKP